MTCARLIVALALAPCVLVNSQQNQPISADGQASLADTLDFMNRALEQDGAGSIISNNGASSDPCEITFVRSRLESALVLTGVQQVEGDPVRGIPPRLRHKYLLVDPATHLRFTVNLKSVDPHSIKAAEISSVDSVQKQKQLDPNKVPDPDTSLVIFSTSNLVRAVHTSDYVDKTKGIAAEDTTGDQILMRSNSLALRFTNAFKHAVTLCGGKPSPF